ncbi:MAG: ABC transporter permease [Actinomycetota bacterium]
MKSPRFRQLAQALTLVSRIAIALLATVLIVWALTAAVRVPSGAALSALAGGAVGSPFAWSGALRNATPILFTGLAVGWAFRAGLFNIGAEGQLLWGALAAAWIGSVLRLPPAVHVGLALIAGAAAGAVWAWPAALLKLRRGTPEVLTTLLLSFIAVQLTTWLANGPLHGAGEQGARTAAIHPSAHLPVIESGGLRIHWGLPLAILTATLLGVWLARSRFGFQIRIVGRNADAARAADIPVDRIRALVLLQSGALAGLAGAVQVLGPLHYFQAGFSPGYGYEGIPVAILAGSEPLGVVLAALFWGALTNGAVEMESAVGVSHYMVMVIQALVVIAVAARCWPALPFPLRRTEPA